MLGKANSFTAERVSETVLGSCSGSSFFHLHTHCCTSCGKEYWQGKSVENTVWRFLTIFSRIPSGFTAFTGSKVIPKRADVVSWLKHSFNSTCKKSAKELNMDHRQYSSGDEEG